MGAEHIGQESFLHYREMKGQTLGGSTRRLEEEAKM
jgi:hypothetical protein